MASTSTNKQPLLIDRVFNEAIKTDGLVSGSATSLDIGGTNSARVLVNCVTNDGGLVEDIYAISRGQSKKALFFLSPASDYLRDTEAVFVGSITTGTGSGDYTNIAALPRVLAPVPQVGVVAPLASADANNPQQTPLKNQALYVPTGKALWVTIQGSAGSNSVNCPIVGAQGGFF